LRVSPKVPHETQELTLREIYVSIEDSSRS
jgi:hypothetical protein